MPIASVSSDRPDVQPQSWPSISTSTSADRPTVSAARPGTSTRWEAVSSRDSGAAISVHHRPSTSAGTPAQNTHRHDSRSTSVPPTSGPSASARAEMPAQMPSARARVLSSKTELTSARDSVSIPAAPVPWMNRATISTSIDGRQRGEHQPDGERHQAADEDAPAAELVAQAPGGDHEHGDRQQVAVDDPLQLAGGRAQVVLDRGQRQRHHRRVEHQHEQRHARPGQRPPGPVGLGHPHAEISRRGPV